jgi:hypothetical protein
VSWTANIVDWDQGFRAGVMFDRYKSIPVGAAMLSIIEGAAARAAATFVGNVVLTTGGNRRFASPFVGWPTEGGVNVPENNGNSWSRQRGKDIAIAL